MNIVNNCLVVPVESELNDAAVLQLQKRILEKTHGASVRGVLIDVSAIRVLDSFHFSILADTARMLTLLGSRTVFVGFQPGVASALIDLEVDLAHIDTAMTMEDGFEQLLPQAPRPKDSEGPEMDEGNEEQAPHVRAADSHAAA